MYLTTKVLSLSLIIKLEIWLIDMCIAVVLYSSVSVKSLWYRHRVHVSPKCGRVLATWAQSWHKIQPEITIQYLKLIIYYVDTTFVLSNLRTGQGLSTELGEWKILGKFASFSFNNINNWPNVGKVRNNLVMSTFGHNQVFYYLL